MSAVVAAELVLAVLVVLLVGALIFVWVRRRLISGDGRPVMLCALRDDASSRWRLGLARLGVESAFLGKVGDDPFGRFLEGTFASAGVDTRWMRFDAAARTVVAWANGFIAMELAGAFQLGGDVDRAFDYGIDHIVAAIATQPKRT